MSSRAPSERETPERGPRLGTARAANLVHASRRYELYGSGLTIGREADNDVVLDEDRASRHHARVRPQHDGSWAVEDLGALNGTFVNGDRVTGRARGLANGDSISIGGATLRFVTGDETRFDGSDARQDGGEDQEIRLRGKRLAIGRDASNDLVLDDPNVSRFHAEVTVGAGQVELRDLGSRNGTRLNGEPISTERIKTGAHIGIGPFRLVFNGSSFVAHDDRGAVRLDAHGVSVLVKDKQILAPTSLSIEPGEFVAVIGESGSGKTTLVKALGGVSVPTVGFVTLNGELVESRLTDLGYVPQDEIVHHLLTVREALGYAAELRLPGDTRQAEISANVDRVMAELGLAEHADTRIGSLSGGQRKRTGVATELLSRPSLLLLDEPTTGLDPYLESKMMTLLRTLADGSRAVVVVTHTTRSLGLCDKVAVMGRGGQLAFFGSPADTLRFFEVEGFDEIYTELARRPGAEWRRLYEADASAGREDTAPHAPPQLAVSRGRPRPRAGRTVSVLIGRYLRLLARDRRNMLIVFGQVPVIALAIAGLFHQHVLARGHGSPGDSAQLLFLMVTTALWLGSIDASREIIKEKSVFDRERAIGVRVGTYLLSKAVVLFGLAVVQTVLLGVIVLGLRPLGESAGTYGLVFALLAMTAFVAVGLGLIVSAAVNSQDQATSLIPLVLIPQLLFAGAIVPVAKMSTVVAALSSLAFAQWSFAGVGTAVHLNARIAEDPQFAAVDRYGSSFFNVPAGEAFLALGIFLLVFFLFAAALLHRRA